MKQTAVQKTVPGPLPISITTAAGQVQEDPMWKTFNFSDLVKGVVPFTIVSEAPKEEPFPVTLRLFLLLPTQNIWT